MMDRQENEIEWGVCGSLIARHLYMCCCASIQSRSQAICWGNLLGPRSWCRLIKEIPAARPSNAIRTSSWFSTQWPVPLPSASSWRSHPAAGQSWLLKGWIWSTRALRDRLLGRWIKVRGWMLFDVEHQNASENTAPGRERNWRATAWEIHPITSIEVGAATCEIAEFARRASPLDFAPNAPSVGGWSPPNPKNWSVWYSLGTEIEPYCS
jgi:hypothetical protein